MAGAGDSPEATFRQTQVKGMGGRRVCSDSTAHMTDGGGGVGGMGGKRRAHLSRDAQGKASAQGGASREVEPPPPPRTTI